MFTCASVRILPRAVFSLKKEKAVLGVYLCLALFIMYIQYGSATCTQGIKCLHLTRAQNTCRKKHTRFTRGQNAYAKPQMHFTCEVNERQTRPRMTRPKREANVFVGKVSYHFSIHVSSYALLYDLYQHDSLPRLIFVELVQPLLYFARMLALLYNM